MLTFWDGQQTISTSSLEGGTLEGKDDLSKSSATRRLLFGREKNNRKR